MLDDNPNVLKRVEQICSKRAIMLLVSLENNDHRRLHFSSCRYTQSYTHFLCHTQALNCAVFRPPPVQPPFIPFALVLGFP